MQDIETIATKIVYENRWLRVREDAIIHRDGTLGIYGVVEKADFAIIAPIENGHIHLVEQFRYPVQGRYWELPQGSWEETPDARPEDLARAELLEETGLVAAIMLHVGHLFECYGFSEQGFHIYLEQGLTQGTASREATEQDMVCRAFSIQEALAMIAEGAIKDAATVAAVGLLRLKGLV